MTESQPTCFQEQFLVTTPYSVAGAGQECYQLCFIPLKSNISPARRKQERIRLAKTYRYIDLQCISLYINIYIEMIYGTMEQLKYRTYMLHPYIC